MAIDIDFKEIIWLTIIFTLLTFYFDIYRKKRVTSYVITHLLAIVISLGISKMAYDVIHPNE
jgi:hypothetical protein